MERKGRGRLLQGYRGIVACGRTETSSVSASQTVCSVVHGIPLRILLAIHQTARFLWVSLEVPLSLRPKSNPPPGSRVPVRDRRDTSFLKVCVSI